MQSKVRLWVHVGAGKTGTSSIQATLDKCGEAAKAKGYWYLGMSFENAEKIKFSWQRRGGSEEIFSLSPELAAAQVAEALMDSLDVAAARAIRNLIWSNESLLDRGDRFFEMLKTVQGKGVEVRIVCYVRRYDAWARSAYVQWGIKHKTYEGPVRTFHEWASSRKIGFATSLKKWQAEFGTHALSVRNMDKAGDVVADFLSYMQMPMDDIEPLRIYEMPSAEEIALRAFLNNRIEAKVLPNRFDQLIGWRNVNVDFQLSDILSSYMPTPSDLAGIMQSCEADRAIVDEMLRDSGQPVIDASLLRSKEMVLDEGRLTSILFQVLINQAFRIQKLEKELKELLSRES